MDIYKVPVFSAADIFPMLDKDELGNLAADIKENGLREPIVTAEIADADGVLNLMLVDGRNRLAACKIAEVDPTVRQLNGEDPRAFVMSVNLHRRHMTKGQQAMAAAMLYPDAEKGGRGKRLNNSTVSEIDGGYLSKARTIYHKARDLRDLVIAGTMTLDAAYQETRDRLKKASTEEQRIASVREKYPDLADKVVEGDMGIAAVEVEANERDAIEAEARETAVRIFEDGLRNLAGFASDGFIEKLEGWSENKDFVKLFRSRVRRPNVDLRECVKRLEKTLLKLDI